MADGRRPASEPVAPSVNPQDAAGLSQPPAKAVDHSDSVDAPQGHDWSHDDLAGMLARTKLAEENEIKARELVAKQQADSHRELAGALYGHFKDKIQEISNDTSLTKETRAKSIRAFNEINDELKKLHCLTTDETLDGNHQAVRDCFKRISIICNSVTKFIPKGSDLRTTFNQFGELSNALKRYHFTRSADYEAEHYAESLQENLGKICPGLRAQRPGSEINRSDELAVGISTSIIPLIFSAGPKAVCRAIIQKANKIDEDGDNLSLSTKIKVVEAGLQAKFLCIPDFKNTKNNLLSISLMAKAICERGNYDDYKSLVKQLMATNRSEANHWRYLNRSGSKNSAGSRFVAVMQWPRNMCYKIAIGEGYKSPGRMPNFSQEKLNKGTANQVEILLKSAALFGTPPDAQGNKSESPLEKIFNNHYQSPADKLKELGLGVKTTADAKKLPPNPLNVSSPLPTPSGGRSKNNYDSVHRNRLNLELKGNFGIHLPGGQGGELQLGANASMSVEVGKGESTFMKFILPHRQIDPHFSADAEYSHHLVHTYEATYRDRPESHLLCKTKYLLDQGLSRNEGIQRGSAVDRLSRANTATNKILESYTELIELAGMLKSIQTSKKGKAPFSIEETQKFESRFTTLSNDLFGIEKRPITLKKFAEKLRKDPEFFMVTGFCAISIALGQVGLHLYDTNMHCDLQVAADGRTSILDDLRKKVEGKYAFTSKVMDAFSLPMDQETACRKFTIVPLSKSASKTHGFSVDMSAGAFNSALSYISGNSSEPTSSIAPGNSNSVVGRSGNASLLAVGGGLQMFHRLQELHPNVARSGTFQQTKASVRGEGMMGQLLVRAADFMEQMTGGGKDRLEVLDYSTVADKNKQRRFLENAGTAFAGSTVSMIGREKVWSWSDRTPLSVEGLVYEKHTQCARVASCLSTDVSIAAGVPMQAGGLPMTVSLSYRHTETASNVVFESLGTCVGYHLIQTDGLRNFLKNCAVPNKSKNQDKEWVLDFDKMREYFTPNDASKPPQKLVDSTYMCHKYFATNDSVLGFMDSYIHYSDNPREWGGKRQDKNIGSRNEFHRFDDEPEIWASMNSSTKSRGGSSLVDIAVHRTIDLGNLKGGKSEHLDPRPRWTKPEMAIIKSSMQTMRSALEDKSITPEERMQKFLSTEEGRTVFEAYLKVVFTYSDINAAVKASVTYQSAVVPPDNSLF